MINIEIPAGFRYGYQCMLNSSAWSKVNHGL